MKATLSGSVLVLFKLLLPMLHPDTVSAQPNGTSEIQFTDCTEYVGITTVPHPDLSEFVPETYSPVLIENEGILVLRVAHCEAVSVAGRVPQPAITAQVGIRVQGPETADIHNYTLWYLSNNGQLVAALRALGVSAEMDSALQYEVSGSMTNGEPGSLVAEVEAPRSPVQRIAGEVFEPATTTVPFTASWWSLGRQGHVRMRTVFPSLRFGAASVALTTESDSELGHLIGDGQLQFVLLDSYNAFAEAHMEITSTEQAP